MKKVESFLGIFSGIAICIVSYFYVFTNLEVFPFLLLVFFILMISLIILKGKQWIQKK